MEEDQQQPQPLGEAGSSKEEGAATATGLVVPAQLKLGDNFQIVKRPGGRIQQPWYSAVMNLVELEKCIQIDGDGTPMYQYVQFPKLMLDACLKKFPSIAVDRNGLVLFLATTIRLGSRVVLHDSSASTYTHKYFSFLSDDAYFRVILSICGVRFIVKFVRMECGGDGIVVALSAKTKTSNIDTELNCVQTKEWV